MPVFILPGVQSAAQAQSTAQRHQNCEQDLEDGLVSDPELVSFPHPSNIQCPP